MKTNVKPENPDLTGGRSKPTERLFARQGKLRTARPNCAADILFRSHCITV